MNLRFFCLGLLACGLLTRGADLSVLTPFSTPSNTRAEASLSPVFTPDGHFLFFQSGDGKQLKKFDLNTLQVSQTDLPGLHRQSFMALWPRTHTNFAFETDGRGLVPGTTNGVPDLFTVVAGNISKLSTNTQFRLREYGVSPNFGQLAAVETSSASTRLLIYSLASNRVETANQNTSAGYLLVTQPSVNNSGRRVAFVSSDMSATQDPTGPGQQVYWRNLDASITHSVFSYARAADASISNSFNPKFCGNGGFLFFIGYNTNGVTNLMRLSMTQFACDIIATNWDASAEFGASERGDVVALQRNGKLSVWRDNSIDAVSSPLFNTNANSSGPAISQDGRYLTFLGRDEAGVTQVFQHDLGAGTTRLVSQKKNGSGLSSDVAQFAVSLNGSAVAFVTDDSNVVDGDNNGTYDVFVSTGGEPFLASKADHDTRVEVLRSFIEGQSSTAGDRYIALEADGLRNFYRANHMQVYLFDLVTRTNTMVSATPEGIPGNGASSNIVMSANGKKAAFISHGTDLVTSFAYAGPKVILKDLVNGESIGLTAGTTTSPLHMSRLSLSADGNRLAYQSAGAFEGDHKLYVYDLSTRTNLNVAVSERGTSVAFWPAERFQPVISPNGRFVLFQSTANLTQNSYGSGYKIYLRDLQRPTAHYINVRHYYGGESLSSGLYSFNANSTVAAGLTSDRVLWVYDTVNKEIISAAPYVREFTLSGGSPRVAYVTGGELRLIELRGNGSNSLYNTYTDTIYHGRPYYPLLSFDGQFVVFACQGTNVVSGYTNRFGDIFAYDIAARQVFRLTSTTNGHAPNGKSTQPILMQDGRTVIFRSFASNLMGGDSSFEGSLYTVQLSSGDTDLDSLADDWEVVWFGDLTQSGDDDFDNDGATNIQEYYSYTKPDDTASVFRPVIIKSSNSSSVQIRWAAVFGKTYRIQYKDDLSQAWQDLPWQNINSSEGTAADSMPSSIRRFYRVRMY